MEAKKPSRWRTFRRQYVARPTAKPRWNREPYHLGLWFDIVVVVGLAVSVIGYITG
jgi:hypothetical protein